MRIDLSEQSQEALAEVISGGSANDPTPVIGLYRQGWRIQQFMQQVGVDVAIDGRSRVAMTRAAIADAHARSDGGATIKAIVEKAADPRDFIEQPERHVAVLDHLNRYLAYDGLRLEREGNRVRLMTERSSGVLTAIAESAEAVDFDTVERDLARARASAETDPEDAVTAACSVVESVCRSILVELGLGLPARKDIQGLYQAVREPLGLSPAKDGIPDLIESDVRTILGGLNTVITGIGSLRTHAGDAHGRERGYRRIDARIARLAIHSASTAALFLIETWQLRHPGRVLRRE
jgi:hypothetical protein